MIVALRILFGAIFVFMVVATAWTSSRVGVLEGGATLIRQPWGVMTLFDAYFGFLTFYSWLAYKERSALSRLSWFVLIMTLGNIAMAFYMLVQLFRVPATASIEAILLRKPAE